MFYIGEVKDLSCAENSVHFVFYSAATGMVLILNRAPSGTEN